MKHNCILVITLIFSMLLCHQCITALAEDKNFNPDKYYKFGTKTAQEKYWGIKPYVTGLAVGILLPAAVIASVSKIRKESGNSDLMEVAGGMSVFAASVWGGYTIAKMYKTPKPDRYLADLTEAQKQSFEGGFNNRVKDKRFGNYTLGIYSGIAVNIAAILIILSGIDGFGGV